MKLLAIFAHPDDESFGPAGTLAKCSEEGHSVGLVTLTRGEAGSLGISKDLAAAKLGQRRSLELQCAAKIIGISYLRIYDLPDKKLNSIPENQGLQIIKKEIESFQPDALITFHDNGISGHPDHKTVTRWILQTIDQMQNSPVLYYYGILPDHAKMIPQRKLFPISEQDVTHRINVRQYSEIKKSAIECHSTQKELWKIFQNLPVSFGELSEWENFIRIRPLPSGSQVSHTIFE
jgi:LmbE family N-acetylglucosaminyl deacetylase